MRMDLILFDWGGTLVEVVGQAESLRRGAKKAASILHPVADNGDVDRLIKAILSAESLAAADPNHREADLPAILVEWASAAAGTVDPGRLAAARDALGQSWLGSLEIKPDAFEAVRLLHQQGYRMGLVSNCCTPVEYCHMELERQGLARWLDFAVFSSGVGYRKPAPAIYEAALARAYPEKRPADLSRVLFVGDSPAFDVSAPAIMGMRTALVQRPPGEWPEADYANARPDWVVKGVDQLPAMLAKDECGKPA